MDVAASVTTGRTFPNGEHLEHVGHVGGVVILSAEDGLADTIRPRGDVAGVDVGSIVAISTVPDGQGNERTISIPEDVASIVEVIRRVGAKLVIVDPLMAFLSGKANYAQDVRKALTPLARDCFYLWPLSSCSISYAKSGTQDSANSCKNFGLR
jgi:RecA-family ATPase